MVYGQDGTTRITAPDGTVTTAELGPDPRWGMRAPIPVRVETRTPGGRTKLVTRERFVELTNPANPFAIDTLRDDTTIAGDSHSAAYDGTTRTLTVDSAENRRQTTRFDAKGRVVEKSLGAGLAPLQAVYDARGRLASTTRGATGTTFTYDPAHPFRIRTRTDAEDRTVTYGYDDAERVTNVELPSGRVYDFAYDDNGNRTSITMPDRTPAAKLHAFGFSDVGQATSYTPPGSPGSFTRTFDEDRSLATLALPGGRTVTNSRDDHGRLTGIAYADGSTSHGSTALVHDDADRITESTRVLPGGRTDTMRSTFDGSLLATREARDASGAYASLAYEYGDDLKPSRIVTTAGADSVPTALVRDDDGLLTGIGPFTVTRDAAGAATALAGEGLTLGTGHDALGRPSTRTMTAGGTQRYSATLHYDDASRLTGKTETVDGGPAREYAYAYGDDGELLTVRRDGAVVESYTYDDNGNRLTSKVGSGPEQSATYDEQDRLTARGGTTYGFDAAGFMTSRGASDSFTYSSDGELLEATVGGETVRYTYDSVGRRVARTDADGRYEYVYGDQDRPFLVTASRAPGGRLTTYTYGPDGLLASIRRGDARFHVATDQVGTPRVVTDSAGAIVKTLSYDAFGGTIADSDPSFDLPLGFAGGLADPATGLVRFGVRDYDPASGRWTSRDPILHHGGLNLYAYAGNRPLSHRDMSGMDGDWSLSGIAQAVGEFFSDGPGGTAAEVVSNIDSDSPIVDGAGKLTEGMDAIETVTDVAETVVEIDEALDEESEPDQAAGLLKCGLKWIKKILPVDVVGVEAAEQALDQGLEQAHEARDRYQQDMGTMGSREQWSQIEGYR
jgi:RHS repeat-associated protein